MDIELPADDIQEQNIIIELEEYMGTDFILSCNSYSLLGLETEHPILKIDNCIWKGTWESPIGTPLIFKANEDLSNPLSFHTKVTKKLKFKRVILHQNEAGDPTLVPQNQ